MIWKIVNFILDDWSITTVLNIFLKLIVLINWGKMQRNILPSDNDSQGFNLAMFNETQVNKVISSLRNTKCRDVHLFDTKFSKLIKIL